MSGLEVLGVLASTAQLLTNAVTITSRFNELRGRIRDAPKRVEQYDRRLKQLSVVTKHIEGNLALQSGEVNIYLAAIAAKTTAIESILAKFERSSGTRRHWKIMSGELSRELDESFGDVKITIEFLALLINSQTAHGQQELGLALRRAGMVSTSAEATTTTHIPPLNQEVFTMARGLNRKAGSHSFKGLMIEDNGSVQMGNVSTGTSHIDANYVQTRMPGHSYEGLAMLRNKILHIGNVGFDSEGHQFTGGKIKENDVVKGGDYRNLAQKHEDEAFLARHIAASKGKGKNSGSRSH